MLVVNFHFGKFQEFHSPFESFENGGIGVTYPCQENLAAFEVRLWHWGEAVVNNGETLF